MTVDTFFLLVFLLAILWTFMSWAFNRLMTRISPKYAAKRQLKQQMQYDRRTAKRLKRTADDKARLLAWAKRHPNDPAAKAILTEASASSSSAASPEDTGLNSLDELRRSQQAADDQERRREARKVAEHHRSQQLLDWALANPASPEGRRHLEETLLEANKRVENAASNLMIVSYGAKDEGPEAIEVATRIAEIETQKASDERLIANIQAVLNRSLSDAE